MIWGILIILVGCVVIIAGQPRDRLPNWLHFVSDFPVWTSITLTIVGGAVTILKEHFEKESPVIVERVVTVPAPTTDGKVYHPSGVPSELIKVIVGGNTIASAFPEIATEFFVARRDRFGRILVSSTLRDQDNSVLANIEDNEFKINKNSEFKIDDSIPTEVRIQGKDLWLHLRLLEPGDTATLDGIFYYKGRRVIAGGGGLRIDGATFEGNLTINGDHAANGELIRNHWKAVEKRERELLDASKRPTVEAQKSKLSKELP